VTQLPCANCGSALAADDMFCGTCGTPAVAPSRMAYQPTAVRPSAPEPSVLEPSVLEPSVSEPSRPGRGTPWPGGVPQQAWPVQPRMGTVDDQPAEVAPSGEFFTHAAGRRGGPMSNATRYLCAAAYLNAAYVNTVIGELVASHRAVVPSLGIDLVPIIRHCLNARKAQFVRDLLLTVFLLVGLYIAPTSIAAILVVAFLFGLMLPGVNWERHSIGFKVLVGLAIILVLGGFIVSALLLPILNSASRSPSEFGLLAGTGGKTGYVVLLFLGLVGAVLFIYSYSVFRTFSDRLRPGAEAGRFERTEDRVEERIAEVAAAQYGNVAIYGGENPFIGTGVRGTGWSIAIELDHARGQGQGGQWHRPRSRGYVPIDPAELHRVIRARLLKLRDDELPENERISALTVHDHVVGNGHCRWDSPVMDPSLAMSYSQASPEAIDALIHHPAAGLRYYQRVCISDEGQAVWSRRREVIGSTDQEVAVSGFIYVAVEGRMFYLEFVPAVMPPVLHQYHIIDRLPRATSSRFITKVVAHAARASFHDIIWAPVGLLATIWRTMAERRSFREEATAVSDYLFADLGAHISVREIGSYSSPRTFIQRLDTEKYTKIIERLITDTVFDFLVDKGVDTSAYQANASAIINNGVMIAGNNTGTAAAGNSRVETHTAASRATAPG
jgi:hypothetical protein